MILDIPVNVLISKYLSSQSCLYLHDPSSIFANKSKLMAIVSVQPVFDFIFSIENLKLLDSTANFLKIDEYSYLCDGRVDIEDLNKELSLTIPEEDFDTLGGFVFDLFGKIPVKFEKISFNNTDFIIQDMDGYKIKTVKIVSKANN